MLTQDVIFEDDEQDEEFVFWIRRCHNLSTRTIAQLKNKLFPGIYACLKHQKIGSAQRAPPKSCLFIFLQQVHLHLSFYIRFLV